MLWSFHQIENTIFQETGIGTVMMRMGLINIVSIQEHNPQMPLVVALPQVSQLPNKYNHLRKGRI